MRKSLLLRGGAGATIVAVAIGVAACGGSSSASTSTTGSSTSMAGATTGPTATASATLYAGLDELFHEHVDLTANVVQTAITTGPKSASTANALGALDGNTKAIGAAIGSVYGPAAEAKFLKLWRAHIGFFVTYTLGVAGGNSAQVAAAQKDLAGYTSQFSAFVAGATGLPATAVAADLKGHVTTLETAINAIVAKRPGAGPAIEMAAMHMDGTAKVLAQGIATSKSLAGSVSSSPAALRAGLTGLLVQHVAATTFAVQTAVANKGNLKAPEVVGAVSALSDNTNQLGSAIGSVYGPAAQAKFLALWRAHVGYFVNYTLGKATHNQAMVAKADTDLQGYITQFSQFIGGATGLPASAVAVDLQGHVATLETAIDAIVAGSPTASQDIAMAEGHMAGTAAVLAQGIVASAPSKFTT